MQHRLSLKLKFNHLQNTVFENFRPKRLVIVWESKTPKHIQGKINKKVIEIYLIEVILLFVLQSLPLVIT